MAVFLCFSCSRAWSVFFQTEQTIPKVYPNICEASNFYPLWPAAIFAVFVARWRRVSVTSFLMVALGILITCLSLYCLVPFPRWLLRATFLDFATERRTLPLLNSVAFRVIEEIRAADPKAKWIAYNDLDLAQLILATGAPVLNGTKLLPDFTFFRRLDPGRPAERIYNRYANIYCRLPPDSDPGGLELFYDDIYVLSLPSDSSILREFGYHYLLFPDVWPDAELHGFSLVQQITPTNIWIYKR